MNDFNLRILKKEDKKDKKIFENYSKYEPELIEFLNCIQDFFNLQYDSNLFSNFETLYNKASFEEFNIYNAIRKFENADYIITLKENKKNKKNITDVKTQELFSSLLENEFKNEKEVQNHLDHIISKSNNKEKISELFIQEDNSLNSKGLWTFYIFNSTNIFFPIIDKLIYEDGLMKSIKPASDMSNKDMIISELLNERLNDQFEHRINTLITLSYEFEKKSIILQNESTTYFINRIEFKKNIQGKFKPVVTKYDHEKPINKVILYSLFSVSNILPNNAISGVLKGNEYKMNEEFINYLKNYFKKTNIVQLTDMNECKDKMSPFMNNFHDLVKKIYNE